MYLLLIRNTAAESQGDPGREATEGAVRARASARGVCAQAERGELGGAGVVQPDTPRLGSHI